MRRYELETGDGTCLYFTSEKCRSWRPAKTIFLLAPVGEANSVSRLADFAERSGWLAAAEEDGAVVVLPLAPNGWGKESLDRVPALYKAVWRNTISPDPGDLRNIWCWETLIFLVGYGAGAVYAGNTAVAHPNCFADVAMVDGVPSDYKAGELPSDRWLLPDASPESLKKNREIPVSVWLLGKEDTTQTEAYFRTSASEPDQVMVMRGVFGPDPETTDRIMREFRTRIRWKNSPDGTPARCLSKEEFYTSGEYISDSVKHNGFVYDFFTRLPRGVKSAEGMPVVISLHGHGEPAWLFSTKNGWPQLSDETGEFVLVLPDSPENAWTVERDEEAVCHIIEKLVSRFGVDRNRIYLTGFSNGSMATCWYGTRHPQYFAALSPWNSPLAAWEADLERDGWEMPLFAVNGDKDHKMDFLLKDYDDLFYHFIAANGGRPRRVQVKKQMTWEYDETWDAGNRYTPENRYRQGERMKTYVYHNLTGCSRVCFTEVKDMPHGAIHDEARAAWSFMRRFSRPDGGKKVVDSDCDIGV